MATPPDGMDPDREHIAAKDVPEFLRAVEFLVLCGVLSADEADEWRKRYTGQDLPSFRHRGK